MGAHSNETEAHAFFYSGVDCGEEKSYSGCSLSYEGNRAISYSTCVAIVIPTKGNDRPQTCKPYTGLTLLSSAGMSKTTARHLSYLRRASPFDVVEIPFERGYRHVTPNDLADLLYKDLSHYATCLNKSENRSRFACLLYSLRAIRDRACESWAAPFKARRFKAFLDIDVTKVAADLQARHRNEAAKKAAEMRKVLAKYVKDRHGKDYLEFIRVLFDPYYYSDVYRISPEKRKLLRSKVGGSESSYVWIDGDKVVTSRHVSVDLREAHAALVAWGLGKDMRKYTVGLYTVISYTGDTIKIGCHKIPRKNMLALYEAVVGKPFPVEKKEEV